MTAGRHCGACNNACASRPNAPGECVGGVCRTRCKSGYADCNGDPADGCEVDTRSDARHCGGCAQVCDAGACADGRCAP